MRSKLGFHNFKHFYTDSINLINSLCCLRKSLRCLHFSQQKKLLHNKSSTKLHFFSPLSFLIACLLFLDKRYFLFISNTHYVEEQQPMKKHYFQNSVNSCTKCICSFWKTEKGLKKTEPMLLARNQIEK